MLTVELQITMICPRAPTAVRCKEPDTWAGVHVALKRATTTKVRVSTNKRNRRHDCNGRTEEQTR